MKRLQLAVALVLGLAGPAGADFRDGLAAYERGDFATAFEIFRPLAEEGNAEAQSFLGRLYLHGRGVPRDFAEAEKWLRRAADEGEASAQFYLGRMYLRGDGVEPDWEEAAKWIGMAAAHGDTPAQFVLGAMYSGLVPGSPAYFLDLVQAYMWYSLAAESGHRGGAERREILAMLMSPAQIAEAESLARAWKPKAE